MKLRFWVNEDGKHRDIGDAYTRAYADSFIPRHCAGNDDGHACMHDHPGEQQPWGSFAGLHEPVGAGAS